MEPQLEGCGEEQRFGLPVAEIGPATVEPAHDGRENTVKTTTSNAWQGVPQWSPSVRDGRTAGVRDGPARGANAAMEPARDGRENIAILAGEQGGVAVSAMEPQPEGGGESAPPPPGHWLDRPGELGGSDP